MTPQVQRFSVVLRLPSREVSPNARVHWAKRSKFIRWERTAAAYRFAQAKPRNWRPEPVRLEIRYVCPFGSAGYCPRDTQNAIGALKAAIDGMVDAGVVPDDSARWVSWGGFELSREAGVAPGVYVTVVARTAAEQGSDGQVPQGEQGDGRAEAMGEGAGGDARNAAAGEAGQGSDPGAAAWPPAEVGARVRSRGSARGYLGIREGLTGKSGRS
jgi:hypothetical protein